MAVPPQELAPLLEPIAGAAPAGVDLREDFSAQSLYFRLRDARAEARAAERAADAGGADEGPPPQWRTVRDLATQALQTRTKDLEIAAWLTEAWLRSDGLAGLAAGARLIESLARAFWDVSLFPVPDEDGIATRVAPITGLNGEGGDGTLIQPLRKSLLCQRPDATPLYYFQYADAASVAGIAEAARRQARLTAGSLPFADVETWMHNAAKGPLKPVMAAIREAHAAWMAMAATLDELAGADGPATSRVRDLLAEMRDAVARYVPQDTPVEAVAAADAPATPQASDAFPVAAAAAAGALTGAARPVTREDMLRDLMRIADWFRTHEPQSPLAFSVEEAVRRGRMTWPELLREIVSDDATRNAILTGLGIRPPQDEQAGY